MSKIILISGKKQSGKDSIANFLNYQLSSIGKKGKIYSFADPLKQFCIQVFGLTHKQCYGSDDDKNSQTNITWAKLPLSESKISSIMTRYGMDPYTTDFKLSLTARQVLEIFGTNICRFMAPNCWAEATLRQIQLENPDYAFIADCRFPNELEVFQDHNPYVVRLERNLFNSSADAEVALDGYNFNMFNNVLIVPNQDWSIEQKNDFVLQNIKDWLLG